MIAFEQPWLLLLSAPWAVFAWWFLHIQRRALAWIDRAVAPRFRGLFTMHTGRSLAAHVALLAVLGMVLVVAAARPVRLGEGKAEATVGRVALVIDASASMGATDGIQQGPQVLTEATRLTAARALAGGLIESLPGWRFSLASFSGVATVHLPMTADRAVLAEALRVFEVHSHYQKTGSSLTAALDAALAQADQGGDDLHVVLISDGDAPYPEDVTEPLDALAALEVPIHAIGVGGEEDRGRVIWDFRDVHAGVPREERRVLREYTTRRNDERLRQLAEATGGTYHVGAAWVPRTLAEMLLARPSRPAPVTFDAARTDLARPLLLAALVGLLVDALLIGHHRRRPSLAFDLDRLGRSKRRSVVGLLGLMLLANLRCAGGDRDLWRAHLANERGIEADGEARWARAIRFYRRSASYRARAEVPTHNGGRSLALAERYGEAHGKLQDALTLAPQMMEAHFNDGVTLHAWGEAERDPAGCQLERTLDLWRQARRRFDAVVENDEGALGDQAFANLDAIDTAISDLGSLAANPPESCPPPPPQEGGGGGTSPPPPGEPPPSEPPPSEPPSPGEPPPAEPPPGDQPLNADERAAIQAALERMAGQRLEPGKYHRRTLPEQFSRSMWENPDSEIWW